MVKLSQTALTTSSLNFHSAGGGNATAAGINFQQSVGAVFALWMLTQHLIDGDLQLGAATIAEISMEADTPLDDMLAITSDEGIIAAQVKTKLSLSKNLRSEFGKTVEQIVQTWLRARNDGNLAGRSGPLRPEIDRLMIIVGPNSSAAVRTHLKDALNKSRQPRNYTSHKKQSEALSSFDKCLHLAFTKNAPSENITQNIIQEIRQLTFVYEVNPNGIYRTSCETIIKDHLKTKEQASAAIDILECVAGELMSGRGSMDRNGLRTRLLNKNVALSEPPEYRNDIAKIKAESEQFQNVLEELYGIVLGPNNKVCIRRDCQGTIHDAALTGNLLLIGEPGCGKSSAIGVLGQSLRAQGYDVVELRVDNYSIQSLEGLSRTLKLTYEFPDVIKAWDGASDAFLLIDGLDKSHGRLKIDAFKALIKTVKSFKGRWKIIASIRTFDLHLSSSLASLFHGSPPSNTFHDRDFNKVRHVLVPQWSEGEFEKLLQKSSHFENVITNFPPKLRTLMMVPFNTQLVASLICDDVDGDDFTTIDSQINLLNLYWQHRIKPYGTSATACLKRTIEKMIENGALQVPIVDVAERYSDIIDKLTCDGVFILTKQSKYVKFRHRVLFDFAISKIYPDLKSITKKISSSVNRQDTALFLASSLDFLLRSLWDCDADHCIFWEDIIFAITNKESDSIIISIISQEIVNLLVTTDDIDWFTRAITRGDSDALLALPLLVKALRIRLNETHLIPLAPWVELLRSLSHYPPKNREILCELAYILTHYVQDPVLRGALGESVRTLVEHMYTFRDYTKHNIYILASVVATMDTDVDTSLRLLRKPLTPPYFSLYGAEALRLFSHAIDRITSMKPEFSVEIYTYVYSEKEIITKYNATGDDTDYIFRDCRRTLASFWPEFLNKAMIPALQALLVACSGFVKRYYCDLELFTSVKIHGLEATVCLKQDESQFWAKGEASSDVTDTPALLVHLNTFLIEASEADLKIATDFLIKHASQAVIWSCLFKAALARKDKFSKKILSYAMQPGFITTPATQVHALELIAFDYHVLKKADRCAIECVLLDHFFPADQEASKWRMTTLKSWFEKFGTSNLITEEAKIFLRSPPEQTSTIMVNTINISKNEQYSSRLRAQEIFFDRHQFVAMKESLEQIQYIIDHYFTGGLISRSIESSVRAMEVIDNKNNSDIHNVYSQLGNSIGIFSQCFEIFHRNDLISIPTKSDVLDVVTRWIKSACVLFYPGPLQPASLNFSFLSEAHLSKLRVKVSNLVLDLCHARVDCRNYFIPYVDQMLKDADPTIRYNVVSRMHQIWDINSDSFWNRCRQVINNENTYYVTEGLAVHQLIRVMNDEQIDNLIPILQEKFPVVEPFSGAIGEKNLSTCLLEIVLCRYVLYGSPRAETQLHTWMLDAINNHNRTKNIIKWLCEQYAININAGGISEVREKIMASLGFLLKRLITTIENVSISDKADSLLDFMCENIYFSSGAFRFPVSKTRRPLMNNAQLATFFDETNDILEKIAERGSPHRIYYLLHLFKLLINASPQKILKLGVYAVENCKKNEKWKPSERTAKVAFQICNHYLKYHILIFRNKVCRNGLMNFIDPFFNINQAAAMQLHSVIQREFDQLID